MTEVVIAISALVGAVTALIWAITRYVNSDAHKDEITNSTLAFYDKRLTEMDERHQRDQQLQREEVRHLRDQLRALEAELNQQKGEKVQLERNLSEANKVRDDALINLGKRDAEIAQLTVQLNTREKTIQEHQDKIEALTARIGVLEALRMEEKRQAQVNETPRLLTEPAEKSPTPGESSETAKPAEATNAPA